MEVKELEIQPFTPNKITYNFSEVKESVLSIIEKYKGLEFDEYSVKDAKKSRSELNKLKKQLNDRKIAIKKECLKEYSPFEVDIKELMLLIDEPCSLIDNQVKELEDKKRVEKEEVVINIIDSVKNCEADIPFKDEWLNSSYSNKKIKDEVELWYETTKANLEAIELEQSDYEAELKMMICNGVSMADVLIKKKQLEMAHERSLAIEEQKKQQIEEEVVEKSEIKKVADKLGAGTYIDDEGKERICTNEFQETKTFTLKITCPTTALIKLKMFMEENEIKSERIA